MDLIVDTYMDIMDDIDAKTESIEESIINEVNTKEVLTDIQSIKSGLIFMKKVVFPFRESILKILRSDSEFFKPDNMKYFNDLYDHLLFVTDSIDTQREIAVSLRDMHMSTISNAMNNVMKILTIITSIFIPLSFISGVYGMNFDVMPELRYKYGYFIVLGFMILVAMGMLYYFRKKKWM
jgi:magnesium transporter